MREKKRRHRMVSQEITLVMSITSFLHNHSHKTAHFKEQ